MGGTLKNLLIHSFFLVFLLLVFFVFLEQYFSIRLAESKTYDTYRGLAGLLEETILSTNDTFTFKVAAIKDLMRHDHKELANHLAGGNLPAEQIIKEYILRGNGNLSIIIRDAEMNVIDKYFPTEKLAGEESLFPEEDFDAVRENGEILIRNRFTKDMGCLSIQSLSWNSKSDIFLILGASYSTRQDLSGRLDSIMTGSWMFRRLGVYSFHPDGRVGTIYGDNITETDRRKLEFVDKGEVNFDGNMVYKNISGLESFDLPWIRVGIVAELNPEGLARIRQGSFIMIVLTLFVSVIFLFYVFRIFRKRFEIPYSNIMNRLKSSEQLEPGQGDVYMAEFDELREAYNTHLRHMADVHIRLAAYKEELKKRAKEEAERQEKQKEFMVQQLKLYSIGEIVSSVSHHWREPLSLVHINMQNIREEVASGLDDEQYLKSCVESCKSQLERMRQSVEKFLEFVSSDDGKEEQFNLIPVLQEVHAFVSTYYEKDGIGFRLSINENGKIDCFGSRSVLRQVLLNTLMVAREIVETNRSGIGSITVCAIPASQGAEIKVEDDTGSFRETCRLILDDSGGVTTADLQKGIGLYISKKLIEKSFGGSLSAVPSESGTAFIITIP
jgi:signal transduction histidine kinase